MGILFKCLAISLPLLTGSVSSGECLVKRRLASFGRNLERPISEDTNGSKQLFLSISVTFLRKY